MNAPEAASSLLQRPDAAACINAPIGVLVIDRDADRRARIEDAFSWLNRDYRLHHAPDADSARALLADGNYRIALVGPDAPDDTLTAIAVLRNALPAGALLCYTKMSCQDREWPSQLLDKGADLVFDERMPGIRIATVLRAHVGEAVEPGVAPAPTQLMYAVRS